MFSWLLLNEMTDMGCILIESVKSIQMYQNLQPSGKKKDNRLSKSKMLYSQKFKEENTLLVKKEEIIDIRNMSSFAPEFRNRRLSGKRYYPIEPEQR